MSSFLNAEALLASVKQALRSFQAIVKQTQKLIDSIRRMKDGMQSLNKQMTNINGLRLPDNYAFLWELEQSYQRQAQQQARLNKIQDRYRKGQQIAGKIRASSSAALSFAVDGAQKASKVLRPGYDFAEASNKLRVATGLDKTSADFKALQMQARSIGDSTPLSAGDAAHAQTVIAKSGGSVADIMAATPVTVGMSLANDRSLEENTQLLLRTRDAFGLANSQLAHLGDVLFATLKDGSTGFDDLNEALAHIASVANEAGVSVEQTSAMIDELAKNGITGSAAGADLRTMLLSVQQPADKADAAMRTLGVQTVDSEGNQRPFFAILKEMESAFEKNQLGASQQAEYRKAIFGEAAAPAAEALMKSASNGQLDNRTRHYQQADGSTATQLAIQQDSLGGDISKLESAWEAIGTDLYGSVEGSLRQLTQGVTKFLTTVKDWMDSNPELASGIANAAAAGIVLAGALGGIGQAVWPVLTGINAIMTGAEMLGTLIASFGGGITTVMGGLTLPIIAVVTALVGGALLVRKYWEPISAFLDGVGEGFTAAMAPLIDAFNSLKPVFAWFGDKVKVLWDMFSQLLEPIKSTQEGLTAAGDIGKMFGEALARALIIPAKTLEYLMKGASWFMRKIGAVKEEPTDTKDYLPDPDVPELDKPSYFAPPQLTAYSPLTAAPLRQNSQENTFNNNYVINTHPGMSRDDVVAILRQHEEQERFTALNRQRASMNWEA
jgi:TP901 family phage tail tape measure protein